MTVLRQTSTKLSISWTHLSLGQHHLLATPMTLTIKPQTQSTRNCWKVNIYIQTFFSLLSKLWYIWKVIKKMEMIQFEMLWSGMHWNKFKLIEVVRSSKFETNLYKKYLNPTACSWGNLEIIRVKCLLPWLLNFDGRPPLIPIYVLDIN